jgi:hypothetical protein
MEEYARFGQRPITELIHQTKKLTAGKHSPVRLGKTPWGRDLELPLDDLYAHSLILGASGAGKSYLALWLMLEILQQSANSPAARHSFGILDAKGELFEKALAYLYAHLYRLPPEARETIRNRIVIIDFSNDQRITPYNILTRKAFLADELMIANRIDTISEQFSGLAELSVRMRMILKYFFLLMTEFELPLSCFEQLCGDSAVLGSLVERSNNPAVRDYFLDRFRTEPRSTLLALRQRVDALLISDGVRLSLSASSAPDFTVLQDQGSIVLINTAGRNITRGISEVLQGLVLSDIKQSVFRRSRPERQFLWFCDEAQNLYKSSANREHMVDLLTMGRSFGSFFLLLTQALTSAIRDSDILNSVMANVRWVLMLRSTLRDAELIAPAIPVSGNSLKRRRSPLEPARYLTEAGELRARLKDITRLPDRQAYCWLKAQLRTAVRLQTPFLSSAHKIAGCSEKELEAFAQSAPLGQGLSREAITASLAPRQSRLARGGWQGEPQMETDQAVEKPRSKKGTKSLLKTLEEEYARKNN